MATEYPLIHLTDRQALDEWLAANHDTSAGFWLVSWRDAALGPRIAYEDVVLECLRYGWIDSTVRVIDEQRAAQRLTPRRRGSIWAQTNKRRLQQLEAAGLMLPPGRAVVERAMEDGSWTLLDDVAALIVPPDLAAALESRNAAEWFTAQSPTQQRAALWWIKSAKREQTRAARIEKVADAAAEGRSALD